MELIDLKKKKYARIYASFSTIIKVIVIASTVYALYFHLWRILFVNILVLGLLFVPLALRKNNVIIPKECEIIILLFAILSFFLGDIRGIAIQLFFGIVLGFVGFTMMILLYKNSKLKINYPLILIFTFSFTIAIGVLAEMLKYYLKLFLGQEIKISDYVYAMTSISMVASGALISTIIAYIYVKGHRTTFLTTIVHKFKKKNPNFFTIPTDSPEEIIKLIQEGETERVELKSTVRTNLHTGEQDRRIEYAALKTITAFLNTEGGVLLIGVGDTGFIHGIEKDNFANNDGFALHMSNLIREKIGKEHFPYISTQQIIIEGKTIFKVECIKSEFPVFLKEKHEEKFYVRIGPASVEIAGSKLLIYIENNFKK